MVLLGTRGVSLSAEKAEEGGRKLKAEEGRKKVEEGRKKVEEGGRRWKKVEGRGAREGEGEEGTQ